jgi:hypothetical protein
VNGTPSPITSGILLSPSSTPTGSGSYTYAWFRNNSSTSVTGSNVEYLNTLSPETVTGAVTYTRKVFDAICTNDEGTTSGSYILTVKPTPTAPLAVTPTSGTVCYNEPATITIPQVTDATDYTWYSSADNYTAGTTTSSNSFPTGS